MCKTCDYEICLNNCPEAYGYPKFVCVCSYCSDAVYKGDEVRILDNGFYVFHEECVSEMRGDELAEYLDIGVTII